MKIKHLLLVFLLSGTSVASSYAQEDLPAKIQSYFDTYQAEFPVEKAYLHLDKNTYTLGEDLWFSAYLIAGSVQVPSPLSKTLYVDIFDGDGLLLSNRVVKIENGRGAGDFQIPQFGKTGIYRIAAYTTWMENFGKEYFFEQSFQVADAQGGSFLPKVDFTKISTIGENVRYEVDMVALNSKGTPLANKEISLLAIAGDNILYEQKVQLNSQGEVSFSFSIATVNASHQYLELTYQETEDYAVVEKIKLPYSLDQADIQFLPEGGHWIIGRKSTIAFRSVYPDGSPAMITGEIEGLENSSFQSEFSGLGKLEITPDKTAYFAQITAQSTGEVRKIQLPKAEEKGLSLQVQVNPGAAFVSAFIQGNGVDSELLLVSHTRGLINYMIKGELNNGVWGIRIPKHNLPSGINAISVLDKEGKPLLERLIFIQNDDVLDLSLSEQTELKTRGKMSFVLENKIKDTFARGSFSVAVADADQVQDEKIAYGTIFSYLLLSSDLKGKIYQPGYYFKDKEASTMQHLDLLMLTHGWSRFSWEDVLTDTYPDQGKYIEQGITITGKVSEQTTTRKGLEGGTITALVGKGVELISSEFGPDGVFVFTEMDYSDSLNVTITAEDRRAKNFINLAVSPQEPTLEGFEGSYPEQVNWPEALVATYQQRTLQQRLNSDDGITDLQGVTVEAKTMQEEQTENRKLYGNGDATIQPDNIPGSMGFNNIFQLIQGRVAGVRVSLNGFNVSVQIRGAGSIQAGTEPLYLLDNVPVDAGLLFTVNPRDVESIEVFKDAATTAVFGVQGANGVIAVYTKTGAGMSYQSVGGTLVARYGGYNSPREFYSPKYDEKSPANSITDLRATIYWNPQVEIDSDGKAKIEYYNTDAAKRHLVIIEGMDATGRLGRIVRILE
jgi:TonB-dependent SusC/RagA subfamily outer membrane receptor